MNSDTLKGQWKQISGRAKAAWGSLTDDDLKRIEGDQQRLEGLIQERYGITREEARDQVDRFLGGFDDRGMPRH